MDGGAAQQPLPGACRRRRAITAQLLACFDRWGYAPVAPPALERYDWLARGLTNEDKRRCVRFVAPPEGELLTLRADVTPQIARMVAQRVGGPLDADGVYRLSYAADVVRHPGGPADRAEVHQVGVELLGDDDASADAELVTLCHEALSEVGLSAHRIDLAHTGIATAMLDELQLPDGLRTDARRLLAHKDRDGLLALLSDHRGGAALASLCDRFGPPAALQGAAAALPAAAVAIERLSAIVAAAKDAGELSLTVDLGETRGADYYTGLRLRAWAPGATRPVVAGGRYDDLLGRYGAPMPATGFAIDLDALEAALAHAGVATHEADPTERVMIAVLAGASRRDAARHAAAERAAGHHAWVQPAADAERARALALAAGASRVLLLPAGQSLMFDGAGASEARAPGKESQ